MPSNCPITSQKAKPAEGCEECIKGTVHAGLPQGKEEIIHGLNTYVIGNRINPKAIIVIYSDIFGLKLPNNKLIADGYAKSGEYLVYLPDFFEGDPVGLKFADVAIPVDATKQSTLAKYSGMMACLPSFLVWMTRHGKERTEKTCFDFLEKLRRATPGQKIGMTGFCWGGRFAIRAAQENNMIEIDGVKTTLVDAVVALHPSNLAYPDDVDQPVVPVTIGWGLEDSGVKIEQKSKYEGVLADAGKAGRKLPDVVHQVYTPGRHGFAVRGNPDDPQERKCLEDSEKQALDWFEKYL
ncbi:Alpha/Beta hydrolase protein [Acrodontium crateriforme]|uniref:Alpha/Beta hydrolase protein n=1 Tax=Acrodontium crateriforme TaxID=150365 RepID=A0AAQ3LZG4_9PEZI|nr:Alpha/Beta hydrolase protein [Acrodontium crateriforme]